jgi:hypothetical protein
MELFEKSRKQTIVDYENGIFNVEVIMEGQTQNWADYECMMTETPLLYKDTCEDCLACDMEAASSFPLYGGAVPTQDGSVLYIRKIIYSNPAVIVSWSDDTTTKAVCMKGDTYNAEQGLILAVMKKLMGQDFVNQLYKDWAPTGVGNEIITVKDVRKKYKTLEKLMKKSQVKTNINVKSKEEVAE